MDACGYVYVGRFCVDKKVGVRLSGRAPSVDGGVGVVCIRVRRCDHGSATRTYNLIISTIDYNGVSLAVIWLLYILKLMSQEETLQAPRTEEEVAPKKVLEEIEAS